MNVSEDKLIQELENIRKTLEESGNLTDEYNLTIAILISHLEEIEVEENE